MTIKFASTRDAAPIAKLILIAIQDIAYQLTGENNESDVLMRLEMFLMKEGNRFSLSRILIKAVNGKPAGMILSYHGSDASRLYKPISDHLRLLKGVSSVRIDDEADVDEYYIDAVAVSPAYQGKGYAKQLIAAAERRARELGHGKIALNVDKTNDAAHTLYRKLGYIADKEITIHHKPYCHMVKLLR
jgi:ribosomal protein S18 acetylase RimI-like enzyme